MASLAPSALAPTSAAHSAGTSSLVGHSLLDRLNAGEPYAIAFGGQGADWLSSLADLIRDYGSHAPLSSLLDEVEECLTPVAGELLRTGHSFEPLAWVDALAMGESAEDDDAVAAPAEVSDPAVSVPGILLTQLVALRAVEAYGLDVTKTPPAAVIGHSQGALAARLVANGSSDSLVEAMAVARLAGTAVSVIARRRGLTGASMVNVSGVDPLRVAEIVESLPQSARVVAHMRNGRRSVVLSGPPAGIELAVARLEAQAEAEKADRERKVTGGAPLAPVIEPVATDVAFHHPDLAEVGDLVARWADECGLDPDRARDMALEALVAPVDWVESLQKALDAGAGWILDLGPGDLATRLSSRELSSRGAVSIPVATREGRRALTAAGAAPVQPTPWSDYAPAVVTLPDGTVRVETAFTRLTGKSPVILAGMTPTTVDAQIVAAAANAGFWAELAGGGQVTESIFNDRIAELGELLEPGRGYAFNSLFLDPYLWKLQLGQKRLVQRARAAGAPIEAVIVTAGVPELDEAVALVDELRGLGIEHIVFKPGTVRQIRDVLAIAREVAPITTIIQIEGGRAGGHHSWEDLDDLLIETYAELRSADHVVVCVGGGIGTPEVAASYLTGEWARTHGFAPMPLDGVLVGTAAMATAEATTAPDVKQLLVDTPGVPDWIGAGRAAGGMASGRSQLGADIHEIDNTASRTGRLLDEVAGDADAVAERREEIIAALDATAKPYFGDAADMTYSQWLGRFAELTAPDGEWLDVTMQSQFADLLQRAEARLAAEDRGRIQTLFADPAQVQPTDVGALLEAYPAASTVRLHPADVGFFVSSCQTPGKPVPFVPVIDGDVRRWWRSDSLWQAHDARYAADQVCVIPGPVSVAGIERVDEPVAALLQRFEDATVDALQAAGRAPGRVAGRRRVEGVGDTLALLLAATDVVWAGRTVTNPVHRLGDDWVVVDEQTAEQPSTGAAVRADGTDAVLAVPLGRSHLEVPMHLPAGAAEGAAPIVTADAACLAMLDIAREAAGGALPEEAAVTVAWTPDLVADHRAVTGDRGVTHPLPDVLLGLAWPAVFAQVALAEYDGDRIVEGMLDLVHLDHEVNVLELPDTAADLTITAECVGVEATEVGRVVDIAVAIDHGDIPVAQLKERFAIRGRAGAAPLEDPARAGGVGTEDAVDTPRKNLALGSLTAPTDLRGFAAVTGDFNPIHTSTAAARLAGLGEPIVHGMWLSAAAQQIVVAETGRRIVGWTTRFMAPVQLGASVEVRADRVGLVDGAELVDVTCRADGELVASATTKLAAPHTAYAFPGQGIQHAGMGMAGYQRSVAAREIWDRADAHTRDRLGFSILTVVRDNPTELTVAGTTHRHPDGVLFLTQFTQVAMAVLGAAQMAELRESGAFVEGAVLAGHSVGEYNALAAVSGVIPLEAVVEVVYQRGSVMHTLVPRDAQGRSDYRLAAIRPSQIGLDDAGVIPFIDGIAERTGEFLQVVNLNLRDSQYAIAGTVAGLEELETEVARLRAELGGKAAFILVPGIDVPFHSRVLHGGVPDFRARLEELLPTQIDPAILAGRYIPNLVPRPFSLDREFVTEIVDLVDPDRAGISPLTAVLSDWDDWAGRPAELCRAVLIELLAWQFASPVRWIETQDLMFAPESEGGLGVERFVEIGVGQSPTVANLASSTLKLPGRTGGLVQVLNIERDAAAVFSTDEDAPVEESADEPAAEAPATDQAAPAASTAPVAASSGPRPDDLAFGAADATRTLVAWWTKLRLDQIGAADSIETLTDGASSRRNQLLVDLGGELGLGAIDGAAEAPLPTLTAQVDGLARGYKPLGPVLSEAIGDHLKKILGPAGRKQASVVERVTGTWQLGPGWAQHVVAELAMATREGSSVRGGSFGDLTVGSASEVDSAIDASVQAVAARNGVTVDLPSSGGTEATVDAAALAEHTSAITDAMADSARVLLDRLGLADDASVQDRDASNDELVARVEAELGSDWIKQTAPAFDERLAVVLDDRWASAREDVARLAAGVAVTASFVGTGETVAAHARWYATTVTDDALAARLRAVADEAERPVESSFAGDTAVVTGASSGSIAAGVVGELLRGGATVVATTSSLNSAKLAFFKKLYREHAITGAALWVVPANLASFSDVDALAEWLGSEQTETKAGVTTVVKPSLTPSLLFPFAAGPVSGDASDASSRAEVEMRILLWSVERLIGALAGSLRATDLSANLHVVLPGSPNRGMFGGDGAYGEAKAALDALVTKWSAEKSWSERVTLAHAIIGWVRGTGLMGRNDPLVDAVEAAGVRTWAPDEMAQALLELCSPQARESAKAAPQHADLTGGLGEAKLDMRALAEGVELPGAGPAVDDDGMISALPASPAQLDHVEQPEWGSVPARPEDLVVIVGAGELGPYGSARTRFEIEVDDRLSAAGILELAWLTGLVSWDQAAGSWFDTESEEKVDEADIADRYEEAVLERVGVRRYADDGAMIDNSRPLMASVFLEQDLTFTVGSEAEARAMADSDPDRTRIAESAEGEWTVTRAAGSEVKVPRRTALSRTVGGQVPTGFDPTVWGIPAEMVESVDRVGLWNLICTVDAFLSSGFTPAELMQWVHPALVANTQGTGMGGMESMRALYIDTLLGEPTANDLLQEALPNVIAAHVVQSYVGSYGAMVHPVAACATTAVSVEEGVDKIRLGKAQFAVTGGFDDLGIEGIVGFGDMSATADSAAMAAKGIDDRYFSRANDRRYGGFVESQGGGTLLLARGDVAAQMGLPVLGVVAYAGSFADGVHTSIPAPGIGALAAGLGGPNSALAQGLASVGLTADDIAVISKHDTSTGVNERNESELHERLAAAIGRSDGNPMYVISQKALTGHAKGGAAAFQLTGLCQVLSNGVVPPNRSLDCVMDELADHEHLVWLREPLRTGGLKAGLVTSLGFGHVAGLIAVAHSAAFVAALSPEQRVDYLLKAEQRTIDGRLRLVHAMYGGPALYQRPDGRRLGESGVREREAGMLLDPSKRLGADGIYAG